MRENHPIQLPLVPKVLDSPRARELDAISVILDAQPMLGTWVTQDLVGDRRADVGRPGLSGESVLRAAVLKQMRGWSYDELSFQLADSQTVRRFLRLPYGVAGPSAATLQSNISRITEETWRRVNQALVQYAVAEGVETGRRARIDSTPVESPIHPPDDAAQLWDVVRVLTRLLKRARGMAEFPFHDRQRGAKKRRMEVMHAKKAKVRRRAYRRLLQATEEVLGFAAGASRALEGIAKAEALAGELAHYAELGEAVVEQTRRRVLLEEKVPVDEKVVSIFEPHTDVLPKGRREVKFGHKVFLSIGTSSLIFDVFVGEGNPADSSLAQPMVKRTAEVLQRVPEQVALDGGFASKENLSSIKALGVKDVCFSKGRGLEISEMVRSSYVFKVLRRFRAGVEGVISFLKRAFGLDRCTWHGEAGFTRYVLASVVAANCLILARYRLK